MIDSTYFIVAIVVFTSMAVGLVLTIIEFKYGQPNQQDKLAVLERQKNESKLKKKSKNKETEVV